VHRSGWIASRRDSYVETDASDSAEQDRRDMARMLKVARHRRECHMTGHRGCQRDGCLNRCQECGDDRMAGWDRARWSLDRQADDMLSGKVEVPTASPEPTADAETLLLVVILGLLAL
jgi:hypothetical protein